MVSANKDTNSDRENCVGGGPRKRHGFMAVLFAFLVGASTTFGLMHVGSAHAFGFFGPPGAGFGEQGEGSKRHKLIEAMREKRLAHMFDELNVSDQQRQEITSTLAALKDEIKPLRAEGKTHIEKMRSLLTVEEIDSDAIEQERQALLNIADRASKYAIAAMSEVSADFTPQQRKQLAELTEKGFH